MAGQVRGRLLPEQRVPTGSKLTDVEITQARELDVECLPVRRCRTDPDARHGRLVRPGLGSRGTGHCRCRHSRFGRRGCRPPSSNEASASDACAPRRRGSRAPNVSASLLPSSSRQSLRPLAIAASRRRAIASRPRSAFLVLASPAVRLRGCCVQEQALPMMQLIASSQALTWRSSVRFSGGVAPPPPKPHLGHQAGGAGSQSAWRSELATVPLCWPPDASHFWIILLLSSAILAAPIWEYRSSNPITPGSASQAGLQDVAFVLTFWSPDGDPEIYNSMVQSLGNFVESAPSSMKKLTSRTSSARCRVRRGRADEA